MSIANALNNAISGLTAVSRGTEIVSSNLANVLTPGHARRELAISPRILSANGGGVQIDGVERIISDTVLADYRKATAELARSAVQYDFFNSLEKAYGLPGDSGSLTAQMSSLEAALSSAASRPDSDIRLRAVFDRATALVDKLGSISSAIQKSRTEADRKIDRQIRGLNADLHEIARLNHQIIVARANGRDASSLMDARQHLINQVAELVPLREMPRENGRVALFTTSGAILLDGKTPAQIEFRPAGRITAEMGPGSALLSGLIIDKEPASSAQMSLFEGGSLQALFAIRDEHGTKAQASIDAIARELHDRFVDPALDPTTAPGTPGLFTDDGAVLDPTKEQGLAVRLAVNQAVDERNGGALWRLRDGIGAAARGNVGDSSILLAMTNVMTDSQGYRSAAAHGARGNISTLADLTLSNVSTSRLSAEDAMAYDTTLQESLQQALFADAVDSDREMQMLLQLEQAYAANAKIIQAVDEMLDHILRI